MKDCKPQQFKYFLFVVMGIAFYHCTYSQSTKDRSWSVYKGHEGSTNYSTLSQISVANVNQLQPAWTITFRDKKTGAVPGKSECNPIIVDGVMYASSSNQNAYAVDAATGKLIWSFDLLNDKTGNEVNRGMTSGRTEMIKRF